MEPNKLDRIEPGYVLRVRQMLAHLNDASYLETHSLSRTNGTDPDGRSMRSELREAVDSLRPDVDISSRSHAWRSFQILTLRYAEELAIEEVCRRLAIGKSEFHRDHRQTLEAVAIVLKKRMGGNELS